MAAPALHVLGIRHHGPGSARAVARALDQLEPAAVVIEGPPELDAVAPLAASPALVPPVAGLVYDVVNPRRAAFYPMAVFSPEWVALRWAVERGVPVRFADLPATHALAGPADDGTDRPPLDPVRADPIGALATAAGYDDAERWWEDAIEQRTPGADVLSRFAAVHDAMAQLRSMTGGSGVGGPDDDGHRDGGHRDGLREAAREASMRKVLRAVLKEVGDGPVVMVCGAWHAPALRPDAWPSQAADNAVLKGLPRTKVGATWAPWTSGRLATASGYGAGVTAPAWYEHLFAQPDTGDQVAVLAHWLARAARLLRGSGYDASAASVVEATRLAATLAALRGRPLAGLDETTDAIQTILCHGSPLPLQAVATELLVGHDLGSVPPETPMVPLAEDLARQQRALRLTPSAEPKVVLVDLRQDSQRARSVLFHRLGLLEVHWAVPADAGRTGGTFKEAWELAWRPELAVDVIEASLHGTTVASAAAAKVGADAEAARDLATLARLVEGCFPAELPDALGRVLDLLARRTALATDHLAVMGTIEPLARTRRYGDVRGVDTEVVHDVLAAMVTRTAVGLAVACAALDDEAADTMRAAVESADRGVSLVADEDLRRLWLDALADLAERPVHGTVTGRITRILLDAGRIDADDAGRRLARALSLAADPQRAAAWLDGFLAGDAVLLLHDPDVFGVIDRWLSGLDDVVFDDLLPLVRRTFARFQPPERRRIGELVSVGTTRGGGAGRAAGDDADGFDPVRAAPALAHMAALLGLGPAGSGSAALAPMEVGP